MIPDSVQTALPAITAAASIIISLATSIHAVMYKRDSRATIAWVGLIWLTPFIGAVLYILFGINRIRRKVSGLRGHESRHTNTDMHICSLAELDQQLPEDEQHFVSLARLNQQVTDLDLLSGNSITPLINGEEAYPAMLEAIAGAKKTISFTTYIFDNDTTGKSFVDAFAAAASRGVEVRVLIDAVGSRYSLPPVTFTLGKKKIPHALFMPTLVPWAAPYMNLRNHRKIMVVDGETAFAGGINIRHRHLITQTTHNATRDIHFRITGPLTAQLQAVFIEDWWFNTKEQLEGDDWLPFQQKTGNITARAIPDGPDIGKDRLRTAYIGALSTARKRVRIITPYFLPDSALITALNTCAGRGVEVDIIMPEHNNQRMVAWAANAQLWQMLEWGCRMWFSPNPFDHSKIMVVDDAYSIIGSANWDSRSLRLSFELSMECYGTELAQKLHAYADSRLAESRQVSLEEMNKRPLLYKLRDSIFRLGTPYL